MKLTLNGFLKFQKRGFQIKLPLQGIAAYWRNPEQVREQNVEDVFAGMGKSAKEKGTLSPRIVQRR